MILVEKSVCYKSTSISMFQTKKRGNCWFITSTIHKHANQLSHMCIGWHCVDVIESNAGVYSSGTSHGTIHVHSCCPRNCWQYIARWYIFIIHMLNWWSSIHHAATPRVHTSKFWFYVCTWLSSMSQMQKHPAPCTHKNCNKNRQYLYTHQSHCITCIGTRK